jgi:hypothetical protein
MPGGVRGENREELPYSIFSREGCGSGKPEGFAAWRGRPTLLYLFR